jgi:hypothetical protein
MIAPEHTSPNTITTGPLADWDLILIGPTRAELLETGEQIQIDPALTAEAGIRWPVYMTSAAHAATITTGGSQDADGAWHLTHGQDITGRLWDVLNLARYTIKSSPLDDDRRLSFPVRVYGAEGHARTRVRTLYLEAGPIDYNDPRPCLTIMTQEDI